MYHGNISPKTAGTYVKLGRINASPLKRGPVGPFLKPILDSLRWAYVSFIQFYSNCPWAYHWLHPSIPPCIAGRVCWRRDPLHCRLARCAKSFSHPNHSTRSEPHHGSHRRKVSHLAPTSKSNQTRLEHQSKQPPVNQFLPSTTARCYPGHGASSN